jgi:hypothetical protein
MAKALIAKNERVRRINSWVTVTNEDGSTFKQPDEDYIDGAYRIAQISETEFAVHSDLFWVECNSSVTEYQYYYDSSDSTIKLINNATPE